MKVYLIPGLGFDNRIFGNLQLSNIDSYYLNWIEPLRNETIKNYAGRLSECIDKNSSQIVLIGHSMGGIIAQEIAQIIPIHKIILISSIKSRKELPLHFRVIKPLLLHRLFSKTLTSKTIKYWGKNYDYKTIEEQNLAIDMVNKQSNYYLQWALKQLSIWNGLDGHFETEIIQIHGDLDKTFPIQLIQQPIKTVEKAGHFMVFNTAEIINQIIEIALENKG